MTTLAAVVVIVVARTAQFHVVPDVKLVAVMYQRPFKGTIPVTTVMARA